MRRRAAQLAITLALGALAGCGDPLVEGDYRGQPLVEISGTIRVTDAEVSSEQLEKVRIALLWNYAGEQSNLSQGRGESAGPARYRLQVFAAPPARAMVTLDDRKGLYAVARIVAYVDDDGDERIDLDEQLVGASPDQVLTYFTSPEPTSIVKGELQSGYQVMELFDCERQLGDKAMFGPVATRDEVDVLLEEGITDRLNDLDCDNLPDDLCFDLRLELQKNPDDEELAQVYQDRCDVEDDPVFNNSTGDTEDSGGDGGDGSDPDQSTCESQPDHPDCQNWYWPDEDTSSDDVVVQCKPLLYQADLGDGISLDAIRSSYWQFSQCTGPHDPCGQLGWDGTEDGWRDYQSCIFDEMPDHHTAYCGFLTQIINNTRDDQLRTLAEDEKATVECGQL
jgi:hypothetical protein